MNQRRKSPHRRFYPRRRSRHRIWSTACLCCISCEVKGTVCLAPTPAEQASARFRFETEEKGGSSGGGRRAGCGRRSEIGFQFGWERCGMEGEGVETEDASRCGKEGRAVEGEAEGRMALGVGLDGKRQQLDESERYVDGWRGNDGEKGEKKPEATSAVVSCRPRPPHCHSTARKPTHRLKRARRE
jgi:hypothetical protein